jgi:predicted alpha/beta-fold hydrolase
LPNESDANLLPRFRPRFPWYGGDLQTLRNYLVPGAADLSRWPMQRIEVRTRDALADPLIAAWHLPLGRGEAPARPCVVLVHGLTGCEGSFYVLETARHLLSAGYPVIRANLRGAGPSRVVCRGHYCAGSSADLADLLAGLPEAAVRGGLVLVGYSLGGNIVLKYLAEAREAANIACAVAISAPIELSAAARRMMAPRNRLYHRWLLARMKEEALAGASAVSDEEKRAIERARSVYEYDALFIAPRFGFDGADDYYARCSAVGMLCDIRRPTLLLHARDDPWIPAASYADAVSAPSPNVTAIVASGGGHVGFHGRDRETPWHNLCLCTFIERHTGE